MKLKTIMTIQNLQPIAWCSIGIQILLGSFYIALLSQIAIPLKPIPMTLQTFAVFSLALFQGSRKSCCSVLLYLIAGTIGLPIFAGAIADPFWIFHPSAGYRLAFPLAAYLVGKCVESRNSPSVIWMILGLSCSQLLIYVMGISWLSLMIGWKEALIAGLYPFVLFDIVKVFAALSMKMSVKSVVYLYQRFMEKLKN